MKKIRAFLSMYGWILVLAGCIEFFYKLIIILYHASDYPNSSIIITELFRGAVLASIGSAAVIVLQIIKLKKESKEKTKSVIRVTKSKREF
jgi:hypothetical protein